MPKQPDLTLDNQITLALAKHIPEPPDPKDCIPFLDDIFCPPYRGVQIRTTDKHGNGNYNTSRTNKNNTKRLHQGIDLTVLPNTQIFSPVEGKILRTFDVYEDPEKYPNMQNKYTGIKIQTPNNNTLKIMYIKHNLTKGQNLQRGEILGTTQDLNNDYPNITPHIHLEIHDKNGTIINPTPLIDLWHKKR